MNKEEMQLENMPNILKKIKDRYTDQELKAIAEGGRIVPGYGPVPVIDFEGDRIRFGVMSDTHIGSAFFKPEIFESAIKEFKKEKCEFIVHSGDVFEGMSNRPDQIYHLSHIGYSAQLNYGRELFSLWPGKIYFIDGNHDRWFIKNTGAIIVAELIKELPDAEFLGHDTGDISLKGKAVLKLWHGEDGNSYAVSYRISKVIESFTGGQKPSMLILGHVHKQAYVFERHVHAISAGCIETQSDWMRSKRIPVHVGFWIIDVWVNDQGISKVRCTWYPFYC